MMAKQVPPEGDNPLQASFTKVANELVHANIYYRLFRDLNNSFRTYQRVVNESYVFWGLTRDSLKECAILTLCRVFDQHSQANSLRNVLVQIMSLEAHKGDDAILADIDFATAAKNPSVKRLAVWRSKILAHTERKLVIKGGKLSPEYIPHYEDIENLLEKGLGIVNRWSRRLWQSTYADTLAYGADDFKLVLDAVKAKVEARDSEIRNQLLRSGVNPDVFMAERSDDESI